MEKRGGLDTLPDVSESKGRKTVERPKMNMGLRTARRVKIPGNIPHVSSKRGGGDCHTHRGLNVQMVE